jgi:hypothetical protein
VAEFREKVSINDLLTNPLGGFAVGETFFQISELFARGAGQWHQQGHRRGVLTSLSINGNRGPRAANLDGAGLPADVWHRIDFQFGLGNISFDREEARTEGTFATAVAINTVRALRPRRRPARLLRVGRLAALDAVMTVGQRASPVSSSAPASRWWGTTAGRPPKCRPTA